MPTRKPRLEDAVAPCETCGRRIVAREAGEKVLRRYCDDDCRYVGQVWRRLRVLIPRVIGKMTLTALFRWRGDVFSLLSGRCWNRGIPAKTTKAEAIALDDEADRLRFEASRSKQS